MSAEAIHGDWERIDHRADLYSLGMILYEVLVGYPPFEGPINEVLRRTLTEDPPKPSTLATDCPLLLEDLCLALVARRSVDRPYSAEYVITRIEAFLEGDKELARRRAEA